jgi:hypothetical protein
VYCSSTTWLSVRKQRIFLPLTAMPSSLNRLVFALLRVLSWNLEQEAVSERILDQEGTSSTHSLTLPSKRTKFNGQSSSGTSPATGALAVSVPPSAASFSACGLTAMR